MNFLADVFNKNVYYIQMNLFCLIILFIMYFSLNNKGGMRQTKQMSFNSIIIMTGIMCISDLVSWVVNGVPGLQALNQITNILYYASITAVSYFWLVYVNTCIRDLSYNYRKFMLISSIPLVIMLVIILTNLQTGWLFTIDADNNYSRGWGVFIHWIISYGYLVFSTVQTILAIKRTESKTKINEIKPLLFFITGPILAAIIQMVFFGVTVTQCGIILSIVTIGVQSLQSEITTDELTKLNNRMALDKYVSENLRFQKQSFSVLMCDIDKFKTINDTMGHAVGDLALKHVSNVLKDACDIVMRDGFLCRYGGDEFILCIAKEQSYNELINFVNEKLQEPDKMPQGIVKITMSFGAARGVCSNYEDFSKLIKEADSFMYQHKESKNLL